jgi:2-polyprenyl-3-methyl-5-hydroxy-6-metoxy-1,4-benzoquinol methylase
LFVGRIGAVGPMRWIRSKDTAPQESRREPDLEVDIDLRRYERFGWDYDHLSPLSGEEVAWYTGFARVSGGSVLELACGTGRLMTEIATAGFRVEGIDLSDRMLAMAEERPGCRVRSRPGCCCTRQTCRPSIWAEGSAW